MIVVASVAALLLDARAAEAPEAGVQAAAKAAPVAARGGARGARRAAAV